jgi:hypothetical protein
MWNIDLIQIKTMCVKGRSHTRDGGEKKEVKKVNIVDALPIKE